MKFDNQSSGDLFIPAESSLEEVITKDREDLRKMYGSFEEIADRMTQFIMQIETQIAPARMKRRAEVFRDWGFNHDELLDLPGSITKEGTIAYLVCQDICKIFNTPEIFPGEKEIAFIDSLHTRGFQECPFKKCTKGLSSSDYQIQNTRTGRELYINDMTAHLARDHELLEKGNKYGISAKEFYQHFMPSQRD